MAFSNQNIITVLSDVVETLRTTGTYTGVFDGTYTTCTCANSLESKEIVTINSVDYVVISATSTYFTIKADVSAYTSYTTKAPYFMFGHMLEIANTLKERDSATNTLKFQKYPLVCLQLDTESKVTGNVFDYTNITLYLCNYTKPEYKAQDRLDNNFNTVLYPLYENFIKALKKSESVIPNNRINNFEHNKIDRFFWGTQLNGNSTVNIFNDYLDAIEINNLKLSIKIKNCI